MDLDALHPHHRWFIKELSVELVVGEDLAVNLAQDVAHVADIDIWRERHIDHDPSPVTRQVGELNDLAVRGDDDLAIRGTKLGHPQRHILHGADHTARNAGDGNRDQVTEAVLAFGDDEESGQQVLDETLSPKTESDADDSGQRHQARDRHAQAIQDLQCGDDADD